MRIKRLCLILFVLAIASLSRAADTGWVIVTGDVCNVRTKADSSSKLVAELQKFAPLKITGAKEGEYYPVETRGGKSGWAHEKVMGQYGYASAIPREEPINWRTGPTKDDRVLYYLTPDDFYPMRVLDRQGEYVQTQDIAKDKGWIHASLLTTKPYCSVNVDKAEIRIGAGEKFSVRAYANKGVVFEILNSQDGWLEVKHKDGSSGWIDAQSVWGGKMVTTKEMPAASRPAATKSAKTAAEDENEKKTEDDEKE